MTKQGMTTVNALSTQPQPPPPTEKPKNAWKDYKDTLIKAGVLDLQKQRPIAIQAINIGENRSTSDSPSPSDKSNKTNDNVITKIIHFQRHGQG
jgi:hypothetical protein